MPVDIVTPFVPLVTSVIDEYMAELTGAEFKAFIAVYRMTLGYAQGDGRKEQDAVSLSQFVHLTGNAESTVSSALRSLRKKGLLKRGVLTPNGYLWSVNLDVDLTTSDTENQSPPRKSVPRKSGGGGTENRGHKINRKKGKDSASQEKRKSTKRGPAHELEDTAGVKDAIAVNILGYPPADQRTAAAPDFDIQSVTRMHALADIAAEVSRSVTPQDIHQFAAWWKQKYPSMSLPTTNDGFRTHFAGFYLQRAAQATSTGDGPEQVKFGGFA